MTDYRIRTSPNGLITEVHGKKITTVRKMAKAIADETPRTVVYVEKYSDSLADWVEVGHIAHSSNIWYEPGPRTPLRLFALTAYTIDRNGRTTPLYR